MTTGLRQGALQPLRAALITRAESDAEQVRTVADDDRRQLVAAARGEAEALLADARAKGAAEAEESLALDRARARRAARGIVLAAQRDVFDELGRRACDAVSSLLADPARRAELESAIRRRLGDGVTVRASPDGGLAAEATDGRRIDASVAALVERAVAALDLEQLWAAR